MIPSWHDCGDVKRWGSPPTHLGAPPRPRQWKPGLYQFFFHQCRPVDLWVHRLHRQVVDLLVFPTEVSHALLQLTDAEWGQWPPWLAG